MRQSNEKDKLAIERQAMVRGQLKSRGISDPAVLQVMSEIPREKFIPAECAAQAYFDNPQSIGFDQTISQPYIVALMTQELKIDKSCDCLEIGTGSGYQTAILARLAKQVYTIERIENLSLKAQKILKDLNITNVKFHIGDGTCGWPEQKKFDRIIITAAAPDIPMPLLEQLNIGGIAIMPLGQEHIQELIKIKKQSGGLKRKSVCGCRFVRLIGKFGCTE